MDLTRGKDHPTARLSGPGAGKVWHRVQELAGRARKRLARGSANRDARSPSRDSKNAIAWPAPRTQPACQAPVTSSHSPGDDPGEVRRRVQQDTTGHRGRRGGIASTKSGFSCAPRVIGSPSVNGNDSMQPSLPTRRTSVSKSPTTAPSKSETSSTKTHPPKDDAWPLVSSRDYQCVPSPKSPD